MFKTALTIVIMILTSSAISSCVNSNGTKSFTPLPLEDGQSAVYIYRPSAMANALYSPDLYVNEELKFSIKNGKKSRIKLPAGEYNFKLDADNNKSKSTSLTLDLKPEVTYYLRVTTSLKIKQTAKYEPYHRSYTLENIAQEQAKLEITGCCTSNENEPVVDSVQTPSNESKDGFSVDKTQNPFSN